MSEYRVVPVERGLALAGETMGTKQKFWWRPAEGEHWLFKFARHGTGEHWSEKIAAEIGQLLGVPVATVELGECQGQPGSLSLSFTTDAALVHGNELLQELDGTYPTAVIRGVRQHSVENVLAVLAPVAGPTGKQDLSSAADWFVGYLLLDAVILNTDRHHENWGVLQLSDGSRRIAPSYDHASSLGRELTDARRDSSLATRDARQTVQAYAARALSGLYTAAKPDHPQHPADAFLRAAELRPRAAAFWLAALREVGDDSWEQIVESVPGSMITESARRFALELLRLSTARLLHPANHVHAP